MFRHQMSTMAILLDYKIDDAVLLKASVIHDLFRKNSTPPVGHARVHSLRSTRMDRRCTTW